MPCLDLKYYSTFIILKYLKIKSDSVRNGDEGEKDRKIRGRKEEESKVERKENGNKNGIDEWAKKPMDKGLKPKIFVGLKKKGKKLRWEEEKHR